MKSYHRLTLGISKHRGLLTSRPLFVVVLILLLGFKSHAQTSCDSLPAALIEPGISIPGLVGGAISTAAADLNLDGIPDLVTTATVNSGDPHFRIHSLNISGSWQSYDVLSPNEVMSQRPNRFGGDSIIVDVNGDTYPDILLPESSNGPGEGGLSWYENPGTSQLAGGWTEHVVGVWDGTAGADRPAHMSEVYAGDMDGDSDLDLVTRDINNGLHILVGDGQGSFDRHFLPINPREGLDLFDPDADGDLDILINGVWLEAPDPGNGPTQWADLTDIENFVQHAIDPQQPVGLPWYPATNDAATQANYASKVLAVDLNADGREDVVITNSEELDNASVDEKPKGLSVYLAGENGTSWIAVNPIVEGRKLHTLDAADLDLDGDIDLVTGISRVGEGDEAAEVFALLNGGDGTEWTKLPIDDVNIYSGITADFDNDGDQDIVGPDDWRSGALRYFESNAAALFHTAAGDYNCDDNVDSLDLSEWQQTYSTSVSLPSTGANGDGSGLIDGGDFLVWQLKLSEQLLDSTLPLVVPEASTVALSGLAVVVSLACKHQRS